MIRVIALNENMQKIQFNKAKDILMKSPRTSLSILEDLQKNLILHDNPIQFLDVVFYISRSLWLLGDLPNAMTTANRLTKLANELNNDEYIGKAHYVTGNVYVYTNNFHTALENYL
ncbi:MAG: hypothetical protein KAH05_05400, partial [Clostridiales bacterium]|nr:hypothetical protein [Clostridiales bacterium]